MFHPRRIVVLGLTPSVTTEDVWWFFAQHGEVIDVVVKRHPNNVYAFVEFSDEATATEVVGQERYLFGDRVVVRVLRAFAKMLPLRPFPGMDTRTSPLRVAMRQGLLAKEPQPPPPQQPHMRDDHDLFRLIREIWAS